MPRRSDTTDDADRGSRRNPRRAGAKSAVYDDADIEEDDPMDVDEDESNPATSSGSEESLSESEDDTDQAPRRARRAATKKAPANSSSSGGGKRPAEALRTSSRANKFSSSLAEPSGDSIRDLLSGDLEYASPNKGGRKAARHARDSTDTADLSDEADQDDDEKPAGRRRVRAKDAVRDSLGAVGGSNGTPSKSPARRHSKTRHSLKQEVAASDDSEESVSEESDDGEEEEGMKLQRILASRTETRRNWREICQGVNTSEIDNGSRWFQSSDKKSDTTDDDTFEERFLVKWTDLGYLHCSWETQTDLIDQVESAKGYLTTFFRKSENGLLFSADERCDGDYFDPGFTQIDRILEVQLPEDEEEHPPVTAEAEDGYTASDFGMVMDKADPEFENGTGRQFLVKWHHTPYSECTYEFERDLMLNDVDYKEPLKAFLTRNKKPTKAEMRTKIRKGEEELRRSYKFFGDKSSISDDKRDKEVRKYQLELENQVFPNGGKLRDYQAEGVSWMISNAVNKRSSILADEMGLGKTLQTCATINLIATRLNRVGPALIIAPLSTLEHWKREFTSWTGLNAIVYHGSSEDRKLIRELEMVYECDRPAGGVGINQLYLKKCLPKKYTKPGPESPWMAQVVITTPEMLVADDYKELTAVHWEVLVVDEAHRLKNHNSKLAVNLRDAKFSFGHKLLLTGTPIQNNVQEFWTLLNFIDPDDFDDADEFQKKYGDIKSKERIDELHEEIRAYILRRLKEDVEKSVPPKEETLIEVELTLSQKKYYRALYEKNVKFLHKNNKKALDGPSLNNLAMQLRKCCNHLFLLNGVEEEFRREETTAGRISLEGDFLVKASGKLVLLDKLLPRLKQEGHRVLIFSQFKIMLDILEDYFETRSMKFERIDGSITGHRRQQAIDRFQAPSTEEREAPFIMMLSTRAGGVGINLTAADTCIIFDSDWNPQNDLQAQARCHRIGQTKSVKVYRLLTSKTYEMQMFHMSSLKMGLDQAVLNGFESSASGEGTLSKEEVEKLLRHGAYNIFNEDAAGTAEDASNDFVQQDIDSILQGRSRTVVHDNTGTKSNAAGGTFSKARFKAAKTPDTTKGKSKSEDIDIEDPDFWKKMVGESNMEEAIDPLTAKRRHRNETNYSEKDYMQKLEFSLAVSGDDASDSDASDSDADDDEEEDGLTERSRWGGSTAKDWQKDHALNLVKTLLSFGYGAVDWGEVMKHLDFRGTIDDEEINRMTWSILLTTLLETAEDDANGAKKREERAAEKKQEENGQGDGGILAVDLSQDGANVGLDAAQLKEKAFQKLLTANESWTKLVIEDAVLFAKGNPPRDAETVQKALKAGASEKPHPDGISFMFAESVWPSLKSRGWKAELLVEGPSTGKTRYTYKDKQYTSPESVLAAVSEIHPELSNVAETLLKSVESSRLENAETQEKVRAKHLALAPGTVNTEELHSFLQQYAPLQLLADRSRSTRIWLSRKLLSTCSFMILASSLVRQAKASLGSTEGIDRLASSMIVDKRTTMPHPRWTTQQDAVLILAVAKHGWIDQESSCRAITDDSSIKWGPPFEASRGNEDSSADSSSKFNFSNLRATGQRAALFLTEQHDLFEEVKGFNTNLVVRAYDLVRHSSEASELPESSHRPVWTVGDTLLGKADGSLLEQDEPVELPTKKDLVKRLKTALTRSSGTGTAGATQTPAAPPNSHGYAVLDQSDTCNIFLAEMLRGVLKTPSISKACKILCQLASGEAEARLDAMRISGSTGANPGKVVEEMVRIREQIEVVRRSLNRSARQGKNVIRVMLGEEPHQARATNEIVFPVEKAALSALQVATVASRVANTGTKTSGEKAFDVAIKRALGSSTFGDSNSVVELTAIETMILLVVCSNGLPVWQESAASATADLMHGTRYAMTWLSLGQSLAAMAEGYLRKAEEKTKKAQRDLAKSAPADVPKAQVAASEAANIFTAKTLAVGQAADYATDPDNLAKKAIMMLEKLRRHMGPVSTSSMASKFTDGGLGARVLVWLGKEIESWSRSLQLLDERGCPLAYSAVDFLDDISEHERASLSIETSFDKKGCRNVMSQIASVSRIRSVCGAHPLEELIPKLEKAANNIVTIGDAWEKQPNWWEPPSQARNSIGHDGLLLERLLKCGYNSVHENKDNFSYFGVTVSCSPFKENGINKANIQLRANQLTRELHAIEEASNSFRILEERRNLTGSAHEAAAKNAAAAKPSNGGTQTGLLSFFGTNTNNPSVKSDAKPLVITIDDDDDDDAKVAAPIQATKNRSVVTDVDVVPPPKGKRKDDGKAGDEATSPSPGKKNRSS